MPNIDTNLPIVMSITDIAIADLRKYMSLTITDENDRKGYEAVYAARKAVKKTRIDVKTEGDALKESALNWQRKVNQEQNRIIDQLRIIEDDLKKKEDAYIKKREEIFERVQREKQAKLNKRIDELSAVGHRVGTTFIEHLTDEQYERVLSEATQRFEEDLAQRELERLELESLRKEHQVKEQRLKALEIADRANNAISSPGNFEEPVKKQNKPIPKIDIPTDKDRIEDLLSLFTGITLSEMKTPAGKKIREQVNEKIIEIISILSTPI